MLVHGPKRPYACLLCDHAVTKMVALSAHVRKHLFLYVCSVCNEKFVSSQRLKSHLTECHPGLDQEQTFTDSINSSYYLAQPGGDMLGSEASMDTQECRIPQEREEDRIREEDGQHGTGGKEWEDVEREQLREEREQENEEEQANKNPAESLEAVPLIDGEMGKEVGIEEGEAQPTFKDGQEEAAAEKMSHINTPDSCSSAAERLKEDSHTLLSQENIQSPHLEAGTQKNGHAPAENTRTSSSSSSSGTITPSDASACTQPDNSQAAQSEEVNAKL